MAIVVNFCVSLLLTLLAVTYAHADMGLAPLRQVLSVEQPRGTFTVSNASEHIMDGRVSWVDLSATDIGYAPATPDARSHLSAAPYLMVSPAQFRLKPGERMQVEVWIKDGVEIPKGERRSHLLIETDASRTPIRKASNSGLQVDVGLGISAPVILRNGDDAKAKITETRLLRDDQGLLMLETTIAPRGNISSYGRMVVNFTPENAPTRELGRRENVAGFLDAPERIITIPFGFVALNAGELELRFEGSDEFEGVLFDRRLFDVAPPD
ncbi:hypothetical protein [Hyphococcus sp. DH-69]|uniref:hypothetical protein n=1 Tax=Hyphococcus formosus TaxID=3143534 RepID=UPI00398B4F80